MQKTPFANPDRIAIAQALADGLTDVAIATSPLLRSLECRFAGGKPGRLRLSFRPGAEHVQGHGVVCGGITATMLDFGLAFAVLSRLDEGDSAVSIALNVSYLAPVRPGLVIIEANVLTLGYRLAQAEARLTDADGKQLATAHSPLAVQRNKTS